MNVTRDDFVFIDITWKGGFKHTVPCRGYNFKSQIEFTKSIFWIEKFKWRIVTEKEYNAKLWAPLEENEDERGQRKGKALKETPAKRKPRAKASEDSEGVSKPKRQTAKRATSTSKAKGNELRESKLSNVRKPKKDVQGTNNPRTKAAPRTRSRKTKTQ